MYAVLGCLYSQHNLSLVAAALAMCAFACVTARTMVLRARAYQGQARLFWLMSAGAVAGSGVWATHFVAMLAYQPGLPMRFDLVLTAVSASSRFPSRRSRAQFPPRAPAAPYQG